MKKVRKVVKLNQDEIMSIVSEYFNDSRNKYISKVWATHLNIFGKANDDLRLVCVLSNDDEDIDIMKLDLEEVDKNLDFTGNASVDLKSNN